MPCQRHTGRVEPVPEVKFAVADDRPAFDDGPGLVLPRRGRRRRSRGRLVRRRLGAARKKWPPYRKRAGRRANCGGHEVRPEEHDRIAAFRTEATTAVNPPTIADRRNPRALRRYPARPRRSTARRRPSRAPPKQPAIASETSAELQPTVRATSAQQRSADRAARSVVDRSRVGDHHGDPSSRTSRLEIWCAGARLRAAHARSAGRASVFTRRSEIWNVANHSASDRSRKPRSTKLRKPEPVAERGRTRGLRPTVELGLR